MPPATDPIDCLSREHTCRLQVRTLQHAFAFDAGVEEAAAVLFKSLRSCGHRFLDDALPSIAGDFSLQRVQRHDNPLSWQRAEQARLSRSADDELSRACGEQLLRVRACPDASANAAGVASAQCLHQFPIAVLAFAPIAIDASGRVQVDDREVSIA